MISERTSQIDTDHAAGLDLPNYLDILRIVWRRKSIVVLGLIVGLGLGYLYYSRCVPVYQAEAQVLVVQKRPEAVTGDGAHLSHFEDYVTTHRVLIQSPLIVERAIERGNLRSLQCFAGEQGNLTDTIIRNLTVGNVSSGSANPNSVLKLAFRGPVAHECGTVVNAIVDSYKQFLDETYSNMTDDTVTLITDARNVLENKLAKTEKEYREFRETSPMVMSGKEQINPRQERLIQIEAQRSSLLLRRAELEAQLATIEKARETGRGQEQLVALVSDLASQKSGVSVEGGATPSLQSQLLPLLLEEQALLQDYGPNYPEVLSVRQRIESTRKYFSLPSAGYSKAAEVTVLGGQLLAANVVEMHVDALKQDLDRIDTSERLLSELYQKEHDAARELNSYDTREAEFRTSIARSQVLYDGLIKRLQEASLVKDYGGYDARIISPAGMGAVVFPSRSKILFSAAMLGIMAGLGLVYLAEMADQRFRSPEEIRRQLGAQVVGHIPTFAPDRQSLAKAKVLGLDPMLVAHYRPRSSETEAYRAVRTALYFSSVGEGHKVIQITSAEPGDGKSTLAANLAVLIAQTGKKVLLIDADLRKPRLHKIFAVPGTEGLSTVIAQRSEFSDVVQETKIDNLSLLPCGMLPPDPGELLTSHRFPGLLEMLREKYDYVLVDTPPLLAVTDPCVVAPRVDGVLLTVRISKNGRLQARRAKEILGTLDVNLLGVVVNGVTPQSSSYNYGYRGSYADNQGYGETEAAELEPLDGRDSELEHDNQARPATEVLIAQTVRRSNGDYVALAPKPDRNSPWN